MPFVKRTIEPIRIGLNGGAVTECSNELQQVTAVSLVDVMRQLSSLSMHVQDMFGELHREAALLFERTFHLNQKVEYLRSEISQLNPIVEEVSLQDINLKKPFKFSSMKDQQIITYPTRPFCISVVYATCEPPPCLQKLNSCRSDGKDSLKFYTDSGYFFELWCQAMQKESKSQLKRHKKNKKSATIGASAADDSQKWPTEKSSTQAKTAATTKTQAVDQQNTKIESCQKQQKHLPASSESVVSKQKSVPSKLPAQKVAAKIDTSASAKPKAVESVEKNVKKAEQCVKECQTLEIVEDKDKKLDVKTEPSEIEVQPAVSDVLSNDYSSIAEVSAVLAVQKTSEKFQVPTCTGVLDLSSKFQNLYENTSNLIPKENTYENALVLLNEYNLSSKDDDEEIKNQIEAKEEKVTEPVLVNLSLKSDLDSNSNEDQISEVSVEDQSDVIIEKSSPTSISSTAVSLSNFGKLSSSPLPTSHHHTVKSRVMNLPPAPPTPPELYEAAHFTSDICQLLEDVQKKTSAINFDFKEISASELVGGDGELDFADGEKILNDGEIDLADLSDLPPIPSPPKFPPFMETSTVSSSTSFPSPPTPAYNQMFHQLNGSKDSQLAAAEEIIITSNNNNNNVEASTVKQADETSVTSEVSVVSSESESSVVNSGSLNNVAIDNSSGAVRDTKCDLLAAIREGIQLRKVEECRQKIERKYKPTGRLDVQSIMEVAFEMRRKMLEEDDSEEDEEELENNWSDED